MVLCGMPEDHLYSGTVIIHLLSATIVMEIPSIMRVLLENHLHLRAQILSILSEIGVGHVTIRTTANMVQ